MAFLAGAGIGGFIQAAGLAFTGIMAIAQGNYAKAVADMNAQIAETNAKRETERANIEAQESDMQTLGLLGQQEAAQSASGISLSSRSQVLTRRAARELGRLDALRIVNQGQQNAYNFRVDAANMRAQGAADRASGIASGIGSFLSAGGSLLGSSKSVANAGRYTSANYDPWITRRGTNLRRVG